MTIPAKVDSGQLLESVLLQGDLSRLTPQQRTDYYLKVCESLGLNPLTRPFEYINLQGKLTLYAKRDCADQLRKINGISVKLLSQDFVDDLLIVHAHAKDKTDREDEDLGAVACPPTLKGEGRANAIMRGVTKAKRRVTLSISGLGLLDETEIEDVPPSAKRPVARANVMVVPDPDVPYPEIPPEPVPTPLSADEATPAVLGRPAGVVEGGQIDRLVALDREMAAAAETGWHALKDIWDELSPEDADALRPALNRRYKPRALEVERARAQK